MITLPASGTKALVVDPLHDFMRRGGAFYERYHDPETRDLEPILNVEAELRAMTERYRAHIDVVLCQSTYARDEFAADHLYDLCTTDAGRASVIYDALFARRIEKTKNSIFSAPEAHLQHLLAGLRHLIVTGITTTSCVGASVNESHMHAPEVDLWIPRDAVASRASRKKKEEELLDAWSSGANPKIHVVESWREIEFA